MRMLILEDSLERLKHMKAALLNVTDLEIVHTETAKDCIEKLENEEFDLVTLDHDLGGEVMVTSGVGTGFEVARWLARNPERQPPQIWLHSLNPIGRLNMSQELPEAMVVPSWWV